MFAYLSEFVKAQQKFDIYITLQMQVESVQASFLSLQAPFIDSCFL